jgi:transportin-1
VLLPPWLGALRGVRDDVEKEDAFRGLCRLLERAPEPGWACFPQLAAAFASWGRVADQGLAQEFARLLHGYKAGAGAEWPAMEARVDPRVLGRLRDAYGV